MTIPLSFARSRRSHTCLDRAFTLIELLVVISIIALLIAILLPSLAAARDAAKGIQCLSNERQIGISFAVYAQESEDWYPARGRLAPNTYAVGLPYWAGILGSQTGLTSGAIFLCPSHENRFASGYRSEAYQTNSSIAARPDYAYNGHLFASGLYAASTDPKRALPARAGEITKPSDTLVVVDSYYARFPALPDGYYILGTIYVAGGNTGGIDARHRSAANVLWADGHATAALTEAPPSRLQYTPEDNPYLSDPFRNGNIVGDPLNYMDR